MMASIYWISTAQTSVFLLWSSTSYIFNASAIVGIRALGFPDYFRIQLAVLKFMAAILILGKDIPLTVKD